MRIITEETIKRCVSELPFLSPLGKELMALPEMPAVDEALFKLTLLRDRLNTYDEDRHLGSDVQAVIDILMHALGQDSRTLDLITQQIEGQ